jgi:hypothetical protein
VAWSLVQGPSIPAANAGLAPAGAFFPFSVTLMLSVTPASTENHKPWLLSFQASKALDSGRKSTTVLCPHSRCFTTHKVVTENVTGESVGHHMQCLLPPTSYTMHDKTKKYDGFKWIKSRTYMNSPIKATMRDYSAGLSVWIIMVHFFSAVPESQHCLNSLQ